MGWIPWVNLPIGALTIAGFAAFMREEISPGVAQIDYPGALLIAISIICFLLISAATGVSSSRLIALATIPAAAAVLFVRQELRATEPMISIARWSSRLVATSKAASFLAGMALIALATILPLYVQGVMSRSPFIAGFTLTTPVVGWTLALTFSSHFFKLPGVRKACALVHRHSP